MKNAGHIVLFVVGVFAGTSAACAANPPDFCQSQSFREVFLENQGGVIIDYTSPSPRLVELGDKVMPCLRMIADNGGEAVGISECPGDTYGCRGWAAAAILQIGTPAARLYFLERLKIETDSVWLVRTIRAVGSLGEQSARPRLLSLLEHEDPKIRVAALTALGALGNRDDFEAMAQALETMPDDELVSSVHAFRLLGDERAFDVFAARIRRVSTDDVQSLLQRTIDSWRLALEQEHEILTTLRSGSGWDLYKAIQRAKGDSPETRTALLELLEHEDPRARAESVVAIGRMRIPSDFERLLRITLALPQEYVAIAAQGLEQLGDPRAIAPLEELASRMTYREGQHEVSVIVERLRRRSSQE